MIVAKYALGVKVDFSVFVKRWYWRRHSVVVMGTAFNAFVAGGEDRLPTTTSPVDRYCNALEQSSFSIVAIRLINRM